MCLCTYIMFCICKPWSVAQRWLQRCLLIAAMRNVGSSKLLQASKTTPLTFGKAFPDEDEWMPRLLSHFDNEGQSARATLQQFMNAVGLKNAPPEFLTMFCCIFGSPSLPDNGATTFDSRRAEIKQFVANHISAHKMWPHPLTVLENLTP